MTKWGTLFVVLFVFGLGYVFGQTRGIWTHDEARTGSFTLWSAHDDRNHVLCYYLVPDGTQAGAAISCVKVETQK